MNLIKRFINIFIPPLEWRIPVIILLGVFSGLGLYILYISNATSYLSDDPRTCMNCHVMATQYATWEHSSHGRVANCNDCHVPQDNIFSHYAFKAKDGLRHSYVFTFRLEPQVIRIKEAGIGVVQKNCKRCHENLIQTVSIKDVDGANYKTGSGKLCWECHRETPHGRRGGLSSAPYARIPRLERITPDWLKSLLGQSNNNNE